MPNREQSKVDDSHDEMRFTMSGTVERDKWMRVFPHPLPDTHEMSYVWQDMTLVIRPRPKAAAVVTIGHQPPEPAGDAQLIARVKHDLDGLSDADLATRAGELGVALPKRGSKAQRVAAVLRAAVEAEKAKPVEG